MGQRTTTLVTYIDEKGNKKNNIYYNHWGIGRVQLLAIMGNFLAQVGETKFDLSGTKTMQNVAEEFDGVDIDAYDFTDITHVKDVIDQMDNNNGGVVFVYDERDESGKIGFCLGEEEVYGTNEQAASRFVPFDEWCKKVGGKYVDGSFKFMFLFFMEHFHFEIM